MPFRQRMKRALGRSDSQSDSLSLQKTHSSRKDGSVHEHVPLPKYRGVVDPKHKAHLESFSFAMSDWKRRSTNSLYSPKGSKLPSRNNSINGCHRTNLKGSGYFGQVDEDEHETNAVANVGGTRNHSVDYPSTVSNSDMSKDSPEHRKFAEQVHPVPADAYQPPSESELSSVLEKLSTRTTNSQAS